MQLVWGSLRRLRSGKSPSCAMPTHQRRARAHKTMRRTTLVGASTVHALHDGMADGLYVLLPLWTQVFGLSYAQAGSLRAVFYGALTVLQMPAGMLAERMGARLLLAAGTLLAGLCFALLAAAPNYLSLLLLVAAAGTASAVQHP